MKTVRHFIFGMPMAALITLGSCRIHAATVTWGGSNGEYTTDSNWIGSAVPDINSGNTAIINGGIITYTPGGDFGIGQGGALILNGGSWTQSSDAAAWIKIGNGSGTGTLTINTGATFNSGGSSSIYVGNGGTGTINVNGGTLQTSTTVIIASGSSLTSTGTATVTIGGLLELNGTVNANGGTLSYTSLTLNTGGTLNIGGANVTQGGNLVVDTGRTLHVSGGNFIVNGELKPVGGTVLISGGIVTANLISFDGVPANTTPLELSGGTLKITGNFNNGIWNSAGSYVNFTEGSTAQLIFTSVSAATINGLLGNSIRLNDGSTTSEFIVNTYGDDGSIITISSSIPEPSTYAAIGGAFILAGAIILRRRRSA